MAGLLVTATIDYEDWLRRQVDVVEADLHLKHRQMASSLFAFLRATFYRWGPLWRETCPDLVEAPRVLAVGDLHVENFGTWRDKEGRLVWGVNDFDEAYPLPYTNDLVRLAASAEIADFTHHLHVKSKEACDALLAGYTKAIKSAGKPLVLEEENKNLRAMALGNLREPARFWQKLDRQNKLEGSIPAMARKTLDQLMPELGLPYRLVSRVSGLGSLGRYRVVAIGDWCGAKIAREAKALAPSACVWARGEADSGSILTNLCSTAQSVAAILLFW